MAIQFLVIGPISSAKLFRIYTFISCYSMISTWLNITHPYNPYNKVMLRKWWRKDERKKERTVDDWYFQYLQRSFSVLLSERDIVAVRAHESKLSRRTNDDDDDNEKSMKSKERKYSRPVGNLAKFHCNATFMNFKTVYNEDLRPMS